MVAMSQEDVLRNAKTVLQGLEALREDHAAIRTGLNVNVGAEAADLVVAKQSIVSENMAKIEHAIEDAQMMLSLTMHLQAQEAEKQLFKAQAQSAESQARRLMQECAWLRDELTTSRNSQSLSEQRIEQLEEEIKHLAFMNSLKQYDNEEMTTTIKAEDNPAPLKSHAETLQELGFGPEDDEGMGGSYMRSTSSQALAASANEGYEVPARVRTIQDLVLKYMTQGRYDVAAPLCKQTIEDLERASGHDHLDVATMLNILAFIKRDQKKYKEAVEHMADALTIREKCLGTEHSVVSYTLANLAVLYSMMGRFEEAEPLSRRSLDIKEKTLGADHPNVAKQLNNIALLCQNQSKYEEAERYYKRALEIYETKLGPDDPNVAKTKNNLSSAYLKQGKYKEAEDLYKQILTRAHEREFGKIDDKNKPIWQIAEQREEAKSKGQQVAEGTPELGAFYKAAAADRTTVMKTMKKLEELYRREGKYEAAGTLEDVALRAKKQPGAPVIVGVGVSMSESMMMTSSMTASTSLANPGIRSRILNAFGVKQQQ